MNELNRAQESWETHRRSCTQCLDKNKDYCDEGLALSRVFHAAVHDYVETTRLSVMASRTKALDDVKQMIESQDSGWIEKSWLSTRLSEMMKQVSQGGFG